jgi:hypothetical protein
MAYAASFVGRLFLIVLVNLLRQTIGMLAVLRHVRSIMRVFVLLGIVTVTIHEMHPD